MAPVTFGDQPFQAELIVFDKDGTLFDFDRSWRPRFMTAVERLLSKIANRGEVRPFLYAALGFDPCAGLFEESGLFATSTGDAVARAAAQVLSRRSLPRLSWPQCQRLVQDEFVSVLAQPGDAAPVDRLREVIASLCLGGIRIAVVTNDDRASTESALDLAGIGRSVDFIACGDGPFPPKPAPDALLAVAERLQAPLQNTAVVGDTLVDLEMGRAAGAGMCAGVLTGTGSREGLAPAADVVLASIAEIRLGTTPAEQP